jgi:rRNA maturation endonuclease Nob1
MSKEYKYRCKHCNHLFTGKENDLCPNCGSDKLRKILFYELIKFLGLHE